MLEFNMNVQVAQVELRKPPRINAAQYLVEAVVLVSVAYLLVAFFA